MPTPPGCEPADSNGQPNHARLPATFPPGATPARFLNSLEGAFSHRMRQEIPDLPCH